MRLLETKKLPLLILSGKQNLEVISWFLFLVLLGLLLLWLLIIAIGVEKAEGE